MPQKSLEEIVNTLYKAADSVVPKLRNAYLAAIQEIKDNLVSISDIEKALLSQSVDTILKASKINSLDDLLFGVGLNNNAFVLSTELQNAFVTGALASITNLVASKQKAVAFNPLNERAVAIMQNRGAQTITGISQTSIDGVKSVITRTLQESTNPNRAARDIRQLIGLTNSQSQAVLNFRRQLEAKQLFGLTPPDERRLNAIEQSMVRRHMREGHFTQQNIDDMVERYAQSLLNRRALDIARTEAMSSVSAGQNEMWMQGQDLGVFGDNYRKFWIVTLDDRLRATHRVIPNMNPYGVRINAYFVTPWGLAFSPGDYNVNLINCRCINVLGEIGQTF